MGNRLMDLVVLMAELSQEKRKSPKELDKELSTLGYSQEEIEQALFWVSAQHRPLDSREELSYDRPVSRVLSPWEAEGLDGESYSYLLRLRNLRVIDAEQFERIMLRIPPFASDRFKLGDIKALAGSVFFSLGPEDSDFEGSLYALDEDIPLT